MYDAEQNNELHKIQQQEPKYGKSKIYIYYT